MICKTRSVLGRRLILLHHWGNIFLSTLSDVPWIAKLSTLVVGSTNPLTFINYGDCFLCCFCFFFVSQPWIVFWHVCTNQYSNEDLRRISLQISGVLFLCNPFLFGNLWLPSQLYLHNLRRWLSSFLVVLRTLCFGISLQAVNWDNIRALFNCQSCFSCHCTMLSNVQCL